MIYSGITFVTILVVAAAFIVFKAQSKRFKLQADLKNAEIQRQKDIAVTTLKSHEEERRRIGLELHDELGPAFSVVKMNMARIIQKMQKPEETQNAVQLAEETSVNLNRAIETFSNLSKLLYPIVLTRYGLTKAIEDAIDRTFVNNSICVQTKINDIAITDDLVQLSIYRIFQELMHNTVKHSEAKEVKLSLYDKDAFTYIDYIDNGVGFDLNELKPGLGIESISGRVHTIGGKIDIITAPQRGTKVHITVPHER